VKKFICCLVVLSLSAFADEFKSSKSKALAEQLVLSINQQIAEITALELAAGVKKQDININLSHHNRFDSGRFGVVMDARNLGHILSVTPNSSASSIGIRSGDTLLKINGRSISDKSFNWKEHIQYADDNTDITILLERDSKEILLNGTLRGKFIPNWQFVSANDLLVKNTENAEKLIDTSSVVTGEYNKETAENTTTYDENSCGRIVAYTRHTFRNGIMPISPRIKKIDGLITARGKERFKLTPGLHVIEIPPTLRKNLDGVPRRVELKKSKFTINIEPNKAYTIGLIKGAEWYDEKGKVLVAGDYYGPAIVEVKEQQCKL